MSEAPEKAREVRKVTISVYPGGVHLAPPVLPEAPPEGDCGEDAAIARLITLAVMSWIGPPWRADFRPGPVEPPSLDCPACCRPRRERGEVRVHVWRCGCVVRPELVVCTSERGETYFRASDERDDVVATHPTREGAIAAWRTALAKAQERDDEAFANPSVVVSRGAL